MAARKKIVPKKTAPTKQTKTTKTPPGSKNAINAAAVASRFAVELPPRLAAFFDREMHKYADHMLHGMPELGLATRVKLAWQGKRLDADVAYARSFGVETSAHVPLAHAGNETHYVAADTSRDAVPVFFFDYESGFHERWPSFDDFLAHLLPKGQKSPLANMAKDAKSAAKLVDDDKYAAAKKLLLPWEKSLPAKRPNGGDDDDEVPGNVANLLGICERHTGNLDRARALFEKAVVLGDDSGLMNLLNIHLNDDKDPAAAIARGEDGLKHVYSYVDGAAWFHIRNYLGQAYLLSGRVDDAARMFHGIWSAFRITDRKKMDAAAADLRALDSEPARAILAWFAAPPASVTREEIAALEAWLKKLPEDVASAVREGAGIDERPLDVNRALKLRALEQLSVRDAGLTNLDWVTPLRALRSLDVEENKIRDISGVRSLPFLEELSLENNPLSSVAPLQGMTSLKKLDVSGCKLRSLAELGQVPSLAELRCIDNKINDLGFVAGLPALEELEIYGNPLVDLSPLQSCKRLKKLNVMYIRGIKHGFMALARLPFLESIDAEGLNEKALAEFRAARPDVKLSWSDKPPPPAASLMRTWWNDAAAGVFGRGFRLLADRLAKGEEGQKTIRPDDGPTDEILAEVLSEQTLFFDDKNLDRSDGIAAFARADFIDLGENEALAEVNGLAGLHRLRTLRLGETAITDVSPLAGLSFLDELDLEQTRVTSLDPLKKITTLREVDVARTPISSLAAASSWKELRLLDATETRVDDVSPLAGATSLCELRLGQTRVKDVSPLAGCRGLELLEIWGCPGVTGITALADLPRLRLVITHGSASEAERAALRAKRPDVEVD